MLSTNLSVWSDGEQRRHQNCSRLDSDWDVVSTNHCGSLLDARGIYSTFYQPHGLYRTDGGDQMLLIHFFHIIWAHLE